MKRRLGKIWNFFFIIGIILVIINIFGLIVPLGNNSIYTEKKTLFKDDIDKNAYDLLERILHIYDVKDRNMYVRQLVEAVNKNIAHYWRDEGRDTYNLTVPFYKNYFLWIAQYLRPNTYKKYEFCDYHKAIERKVGLCSQHAIIICGILEDRSIPCKIIGLSGHVVAEVEVEKGRWWILDGDYGVVIPFSIKDIEEEPNIIIPYYKNRLTYSDYSMKQKQNNPISIDKMIEIYGKEGNRITNGVRGYCSTKKHMIEQLSYYLIWVIPLFLMFPFCIIKTKELLSG